MSALHPSVQRAAQTFQRVSALFGPIRLWLALHRPALRSDVAWDLKLWADFRVFGKRVVRARVVRKHAVHCVCGRWDSARHDRLLRTNTPWFPAWRDRFDKGKVVDRAPERRVRRILRDLQRDGYVLIPGLHDALVQGLQRLRCVHTRDWRAAVVKVLVNAPETPRAELARVIAGQAGQFWENRTQRFRVFDSDPHWRDWLMHVAIVRAHPKRSPDTQPQERSL